MLEVAVEGLTKCFGRYRALDDVTFTVREGEFFTLLGPSGGGKSTTLMSIAGFQSPDAGRIRVGERTFFDHSTRVSIPADARNLGIVFQSHAVWPHMTVFENVAFPLRVRNVGRAARKQRVLEALDLVEMKEYVGRYPHELSGGQQQRVALARALVYSPAVLLLDEPFSNLDAKLRERARTWLKGLQRELALTTVFVTHDQDEALSMSDRVLVMRDGRPLQVDTPENVYRAPVDRFVAEFVGRCNFLTGSVVSRAGERTIVETDVGILEIPAGPWVAGERVTIAVRPESIVVNPDPSTDHANTFSMRVHSRAFLGDHYEYELTFGSVSLMASSAALVTSEVVDAHLPVAACPVLNSAHSTTKHEVLTA
jgi:iron(III) transport system ATP-binding protein